MFLVGISIGHDRRLGEILRTLRPRVLLLPLATTVGTFAGAALASITLAYSLSECLAVGSGFAYYSLSSIFITQYKGAELGTVALRPTSCASWHICFHAARNLRWISPLALHLVRWRLPPWIPPAGHHRFAQAKASGVCFSVHAMISFQRFAGCLLML